MWAAVAVAVWSLASSLSAQTRGVGLAELRADSGRRLALVIGNEAYPASPLRNPGNDARAMKASLTEAGFQTDLVLNASMKEMQTAIDAFVSKIHTGDVALFFYAGHGIQIVGENFLVPIDFQARDEADARYTAYSASRILDRMTATGARMKVLILDACRTNPFRMSRGAGSGLAAMASSARGSLIAFAAGPGGTADDNATGTNGLFTSELIKALKEPGLGIEQVFSRVRVAVDDRSGGRQTPWTNSSLIGEFYFHAPALRPVPASSALVPTVPPVSLVVVRGTDLAKARDWSATSIDPKVPGSEAAVRQDLAASAQRALAPLGIAATFFAETAGFYWNDPSIDATSYVVQSWDRGAPPPRPRDLEPMVRLAYVDLQAVVNGSKIGQSLYAKVVAGGSTPELQQSAMDTFRRALEPVLPRVGRSTGAQLVFASYAGFAYAEDRLNITANVIAALDDPALGESAAGRTHDQPGTAETRVRFLNLQDLVARSKLGQQFTARMQQLTASKAPQEEITKLSAKLQADFQEAVSPVVEQYVRAARVLLVTGVADSNLAWGDPALDMTDAVVRGLDAQSAGAAKPK
jgi:Skp family chaperone for outer membrane proteins